MTFLVFYSTKDIAVLTNKNTCKCNDMTFLVFILEDSGVLTNNITCKCNGIILQMQLTIGLEFPTTDGIPWMESSNQRSIVQLHTK